MVLPSSLPVPWLQTPRNVDSVFTQLLQFLHTASDWTGTLVVEGIHSILPSAAIPTTLASSIGLLAVFSILLGLAEVAKKIVWVIVVVGWLLVVVRIAIVVIQGHLRSGPIAPVVVVIVPREASGTVLVKKDHRLMGRDFKALLTGLAGHIIIHSDEVIS